MQNTNGTTGIQIPIFIGYIFLTESQLMKKFLNSHHQCHATAEILEYWFNINIKMILITHYTTKGLQNKYRRLKTNVIVFHYTISTSHYAVNVPCYFEMLFTIIFSRLISGARKLPHIVRRFPRFSAAAKKTQFRSVNKIYTSSSLRLFLIFGTKAISEWWRKR